MSLDDKIQWATRYAQRGWPVFVLKPDKTPFGNCALCKEKCPGRGNCICMNMYCHGFYAATTSLVRIANMIHGAPDGTLGIRTGDGLTVLDFEGTEKGQDTYDNFEQFTRVDLPRDGLAQRTAGGGTHVFLAVGGNLIKSRNRVLPDMDVKSEGGYVVVPDGTNNRGWLNDSGGRTGWDTVIPKATPELLSWLIGTRGNVGGQGGNGGGSSIAGGDWYRDALTNGCPDGLRDEFFNRLIFSLRKSGMQKGQLEETVFGHWAACAQPPNAVWYMPREHVQYKIDRTWATVEPDEVPEWQDTFAERRRQLNQGENVKMGRRMIVRRSDR